MLEQTHYLLSRPEVERLILADVDRKVCEEALAACERRSEQAPAKPGFWASPVGRGVLIGLGVAAFAGGVELGMQVRK